MRLEMVDDRTVERFLAKVDFRTGPNGCWLWTAYQMSEGYGTFGFEGEMILAHRFARELLVGPNPHGVDVHHTCGIRECVNPEHLVLLSRSEHMLVHESGRIRPRKTHCVHGHEFTPANTRLEADGQRCRTCGRERARAYRDRKRLAADTKPYSIEDFLPDGEPAEKDEPF